MVDKEFMSNIKEGNKLIVNNKGLVEGQTVIPINEEYDVIASVSSYTYNNKTQINHVPHVVITKDGAVAYESEMNEDTDDAHKAIESAYKNAKYLKNNYEEVINY